MKISYIVSYNQDNKMVDDQFDTLDSAQAAFDNKITDSDYTELLIQYQNSDGQTWEESLIIEDRRKKA